MIDELNEEEKREKELQKRKKIMAQCKSYIKFKFTLFLKTLLK